MSRFLMSLLPTISLVILLLLPCSTPLFLVSAFSANPSRLTSPPGWSRTGAAPLTQSHSFFLLLPQQNLAYLYQLAEDIANPSHPSWLNHMTPQQVKAIIAPPASVRSTVLEWLQSHNISSASATGDHIDDHGDAFKVTTSIYKINSLFNLTMSVYHHTQKNRSHIASYGTAFIPSHVQPHLEMILGISNFPLPITHHITTGVRRSKPKTNSKHRRHLLTVTGTYDVMVPGDLASWYGFPNRLQSTPGTTVSVGTAQFDNTVDQNNQPIIERSSPTDTAGQGTFSGIAHIESIPTYFGPNSTNQAAQEASLDTQTTASNAVSAQQWVWYETGDNWIYQFALDLTNKHNSGSWPQVVSISYSTAENICAPSSSCTEDEITGTWQNYLNRCETELTALGTYGITVIASSGDDGANGSQNIDCVYNTAPYLFAQYPASSPHVTAVGATQLSNPSTSMSENGVPWCGMGAGNANIPSGYSAPTGYGSEWAFACITSGNEEAVSIDSDGAGFTSGGGFSQYFPLPSWQSSAVNGYLSSGVPFPSSSLYNPSKRGLPDVSMFGSAAPVLVNNQMSAVGGTSLSAPLFAAYVTYLNEISMSVKGKPLGWLNPLLYGMAANASSTFRDITVGNNIATTQTTAGCQGFTAATGWDAVTGLGVPVWRQQSEFLTTLLVNGTGYTYPESGDGGGGGGGGGLSSSTITAIAIIVPVVVVGICLILTILWYCCGRTSQSSGSNRRAPPPRRQQQHYHQSPPKAQYAAAPVMMAAPAAAVQPPPYYTSTPPAPVYATSYPQAQPNGRSVAWTCPRCTLINAGGTQCRACSYQGGTEMTQMR